MENGKSNFILNVRQTKSLDLHFCNTFWVHGSIHKFIFFKRIKHDSSARKSPFIKVIEFFLCLNAFHFYV